MLKYYTLLSPTWSHFIQDELEIYIYLSLEYNSVFHVLITSHSYRLTFRNENSMDPDQLASEEASWSGSTLFTRVYISGSYCFQKNLYIVSAQLVTGYVFLLDK